MNTLGKVAAAASVWMIGGISMLSIGLPFSSDLIYLGIYEDYMDIGLANSIDSDYGIRTDYFDHDQVVKDRFRSNVYGMAVVSTSILEELISENLVGKLDWSRMDLKNNSIDIKDANGAKDLFTDVVKKMVAQDNSNTNLLDYGFPYFMNKLSFCYVGEEIEGLKTGKQKWSRVLEEIVKDSRFRPSGGSAKLGLIEDPRSILSLSRLVGGQENVNMSEEDIKSSNDIFHQYQHLISKFSGFGSNYLFMDKTSSVLVDSLVNGDIKGGIMYNADCLYASYGGNIGEDRKPKDLRMVEIEDEIYFLDFLVFSSRLNERQTKNIYKFYKKLSDGYDKADPEVFAKTDGEYKYTLARNFDHVKYTPVFSKVYSAVKSKYFENDSNDKGYREKAVAIEPPSSNNGIERQYEKAFSSKSKSDMLLAFSKFKELA